MAANELRMTVVAKATFAIVPEGTMVPAQPAPLVRADVHHHNDPRRSLVVAGDIAPYRAQSEVLLVGHAYAPSGPTITSSGARLVVHRNGQVLLTKTLTVQGDGRPGRGGTLTESAPFERMPLVYERAMFHPQLNPVGVNPASGALPNLILTADPSLPACFGPIAASWPARARLAGGLDLRRLEGSELEIPPNFAWEFFQTAPRDQRIDFLRGDEGILLGGMHPARLMVRSSLPGVKAMARVRRAGSYIVEQLSLWGDTLLIDADQQLCSVVFRGNTIVEEGKLRELRVEVGLGLPGSPVVFPPHAASAGIKPRRIDAPRGPSARLSPVKVLDIKVEGQPHSGTTTGPLQVVRGPVLPFATKPAADASEALSIASPRSIGRRLPATPFEGARLSQPPPISERSPITQPVRLASIPPGSDVRPADVRPADVRPAVRSSDARPAVRSSDARPPDVRELGKPVIAAPPSPEPPKTLGAHFLAAMVRAARPVKAARPPEATSAVNRLALR